MSATVRAMCDRLVQARVEELASKHGADFAAYLAALEVTHGDDQAMGTYLERSNALLDVRPLPLLVPGGAP